MRLQTMADARNPDSSRRARQIPGPLEGYCLGATDIPVRIFHLTAYGCLVEMNVGTLSGSAIRLQIDLPGEGWTIVHGETLHNAGHRWFAVKFIRLDDVTRSCIGRAIGRQPGRPPEDDAAIINGEANDD
jgi:hypothetical protein